MVHWKGGPSRMRIVSHMTSLYEIEEKISMISGVLYNAVMDCPETNPGYKLRIGSDTEAKEQQEGDGLLTERRYSLPLENALRILEW